MPWHVRDGGVWRDVTDPSVRVAGVWQPVQEAWTRVSGVWQRFYQRVVVSISNATLNNTAAGSATAAYILSSTGAVQGLEGGITVLSSNWLVPQTGMSGYEVEVTVTGSGGTFTGTTGSGVWQNLGTTRTWDLFAAAPSGPCSRVLTVSIRDTATLTVRSTATITMNVEAT